MVRATSPRVAPVSEANFPSLYPAMSSNCATRATSACAYSGTSLKVGSAVVVSALGDVPDVSVAEESGGGVLGVASG